MAMASSQHQVPLCPVCHKADQVKKLQAAYAAGIERFSPPAMPVGKVRMINYIVISFALVTVGVFFILVLSGSGGYGSWPLPIQILQVVITLAAIVAALVLSFIAFQRVVKGDLETQQYLPAWDRAMENWRRLYYCARDNVVFDPQTNKTLTDAALKSLLAVDVPAAHQAQTQTQSATTTHH